MMGVKPFHGVKNSDVIGNGRKLQLRKLFSLWIFLLREGVGGYEVRGSSITVTVSQSPKLRDNDSVLI